MKISRESKTRKVKKDQYWNTEWPIVDIKDKNTNWVIIKDTVKKGIQSMGLMKNVKKDAIIKTSGE